MYIVCVSPSTSSVPVFACLAEQCSESPAVGVFACLSAFARIHERQTFVNNYVLDLGNAAGNNVSKQHLGIQRVCSVMHDIVWHSIVWYFTGTDSLKTRQ